MGLEKQVGLFTPALGLFFRLGLALRGSAFHGFTHALRDIDGNRFKPGSITRFIEGLNGDRIDPADFTLPGPFGTELEAMVVADDPIGRGVAVALAIDRLIARNRNDSPVGPTTGIRHLRVNANRNHFVVWRPYRLGIDRG